MGNGNSGRSAAGSEVWTGQASFSDRLASGRGIGSSPPGRPSASEPAQDHQWLENWQRNEIRWLSNKVEELEWRLRWRTITLGSALTLSMLTAGAAAGWAVALLYRDNPGATRATLATPGTEQAAQITTSPEDQMHATSPETASPLGAPVASPPAEEDAEQAAELGVLQAERALDALIEQASPGHTAADSTSMPADEVAQTRPSGTDEALTEAAAEGTDRSHQASALEPAAGTAPGQHEEPMALEADRRNTATFGGAGGLREYYVSTTPVDLRTEPNAVAAALGVVRQGDLVKLIGRERNWLRVEYSDADAERVTGWVPINHLRRLPHPEEDGP
jgi:hypothetical protein